MSAPARHAGGERTGWLQFGFVGPVLIFLIALNVFPLLYNLVLSFTDARLTAPSHKGVGGRNYGKVFTDPEFAAALRTTALFVFVAVSVELLLGFCAAMALRVHFRTKMIVLTALLVPMMLSPAVMGTFWSLILKADYGVLNQLLGGLGLPRPNWLTDRNLKLVSVLIVDVWMWTPFMMLIALAGLNAIPSYIYEAAEIDRASRWTVFRRITLPMSAPLLVLAVLLRTTDAIKQFDLVMAMSGPNDPATQTVSALLFEIMNPGRAGKIGLGSAYVCVILVVVIALATVFTRYLGWLDRRQGRGAQ